MAMIRATVPVSRYTTKYGKLCNWNARVPCKWAGQRFGVRAISVKARRSSSVSLWAVPGLRRAYQRRAERASRAASR